MHSILPERSCSAHCGNVQVTGSGVRDSFCVSNLPLIQPVLPLLPAPLPFPLIFCLISVTVPVFLLCTASSCCLAKCTDNYFYLYFYAKRWVCLSCKTWNAFLLLVFSPFFISLCQGIGLLTDQRWYVATLVSVEKNRDLKTSHSHSHLALYCLLAMVATQAAPTLEMKIVRPIAWFPFQLVEQK